MCPRPSYACSSRGRTRIGLSSQQPDSTVVVSFFPSFYGGKKPPRTAWPPRAQLALRTRRLRSGSPNPLHLNLLITSLTSLFRPDNLTRYRTYQGGVAGMAQLKASGIKNVSILPFLCYLRLCELIIPHPLPRLCQCTMPVRHEPFGRLYSAFCGS